MGTHGTQYTNQTKVLYTDSLEPKESSHKLPGITNDYQSGENRNSMVNLLATNSKQGDIPSRNLPEAGSQLFILKTDGETS
jgi:hypothetical protein